jgi:hypothetical protein
MICSIGEGSRVAISFPDVFWLEEMMTRLKVSLIALAVGFNPWDQRRQPKFRSDCVGERHWSIKQAA